MLTVVEHWTHSATDNRSSDCEAFGINNRKNSKKDIQEKELCVLHSNMKALRVFYACMTQWRYAKKYKEEPDIPIGMDYASVHACSTLLEMSLTAEDFKRIRILERYVLEQHHDIKNL